jgi:polysaccharide pyruvyl transferase WcaK-like protein
VSARGRYVVINAYSHRNAGDAAIVLATDRAFANLGHGRLVNATRYWREDESFYASRGIDVVPPVVPFAVRDSKRALIRAAHFLVALLLVYTLVLMLRRRPATLAVIARKLRFEGLAAVAEAEGVVLCGGGYFYSGRRPINLTLLHNAVSTRLATLVSRRAVMMPQSIGPLRTHTARRLVGWALGRLPAIVVRERISLTELRALGGDASARAVLCPDVALYGWGRSVASPVTPANRAILVAMDWTWARESAGAPELDRYVNELADVAVGLDAVGTEVVITGHSALPEQNQDDMQVAERVASVARARGASAVASSPLGGTPESLHAAFAGAAVVVGTRLHACLIALGAGSPAIGLAYQPKTTGTYELLGLTELAYDVATFESSEVTALALSCIGDELRRAAIASTIADARSRIRSVLTTVIASSS